MSEVLARRTIAVPLEHGMEPNDYVSRVMVGLFRSPIDSGYQQFV